MKTKVFFIAFILIAFSSHGASAYCAETDGPALAEWHPGGARAGTPIPVRMVTSGTYSVTDDTSTPEPDGLGLSTSQVAKAIRQAIQSFNETSVSQKLYYAGTANSAPQIGISIGARSAPAGGSTEGEVHVGGGEYGSRIKLEPSYPPGSSNGVSYILGDFTDATPLGTFSIKSTLLHEMGHSLGLAHLHQPCDSSNVTDDPNHCSGSGCSSDFASTLNYYLNRPTRDDIEGMTLVFGEAVRSYKVYESSTGGSGTWVDITASVDNGAMFSAVPLASSTAPGAYRESGHAIAGTDAFDGRLWVAIDDGAGGYGPPSYVSNGSSMKATFKRPTVAFDGDRVTVAFVDESNKALPHGNMRIASKSANGGTWTFHTVLDLSGYTGKYNTLGIAYDSSRRLLGGFREDAGGGERHVGFVDDGDPSASFPFIEDTVAFGPTNISNASKPASSGLLTNVFATLQVSVEASGYFLGMSKGTISGTTISNPSNKTLGYSAYGAVDLAGTEDKGWLGTFSQGNSFSWVFFQPTYASSPGNWKSFPTNYWPISVGEHTVWTYCGGLQWCGAANYRVFVPQP